MDYFYIKDGERCITDNAWELCSLKKFFAENEDVTFTYKPTAFEGEELYDFVTQSLKCDAQMCIREEAIGPDDYSIQKVVLIIKDNKIEKVFSLEYIKGFQMGWLGKLHEQAMEFAELAKKMGVD